MAIITLPITFNTSLEEALKVAMSASINKQGREEVVECVDMVRVWREWFQERFGALSEVRQRSNPDDPPDIELIFGVKTVAVEHTRLQPHPLGWADNVAAEIEPSSCIAIPPISDPPRNRDALLNVMLGVGVRPHPAGPNREQSMILESLLKAVKDKSRQLEEGGIICVVESIPLFDFDFERISRSALLAWNSDEFADCDSYTMILLSRDGPNHTRSSLLRRQEAIAFRGFVPGIAQPA